MALEKDVLDAAVAKYKEYKENGFKPSEIWEEVKKDELKYKTAEIDEIIDAIYTAAPDPDYSKDEEEQDNTPDLPVTSKTKGLNADYQEWQVDPTYEDVTNEMGKATGRKLTGFTKIKKVRFTRVTKKVADELNSQSENTRVRLYPVGKAAHQEQE